MLHRSAILKDMTADQHLSPRQFVAHMSPADLTPHALDRVSHPTDLRQVEGLAASMRKSGYQTRKHGGMSGDTHTYPMSTPITLVHDVGGSYLSEGNHRAHAAHMAGLEKVPVLVKDFRP